MSERPPYRLPHTVVPQRYQLEIAPDLPTGRFGGTAAITVEVREPVTEMVLNALDLTIHEVRLEGQDGVPMVGSVSYNLDEEQVVLSWSETIAPGSWSLVIRYDGQLGQDLRGFYRASVEGPGGEPIIVAATQCEATDARQIFPGWDEPEFKAVFSVTLTVDPGLGAFSNAREVSNVLDPDGKRRVTFADTIPMSTYLVAFVVGPYEWTRPVTLGRTPVRIVALRGSTHLTGLAQQAAVDTLRFFEEYFGIPYPGDKLDHIAVPDFAAGAMENLGLVTYRDEYLLIDPERASQMERAEVVSVMAHETAHMWFGDLVTMRWWNGIWLNEAFATFMQMLASDALHPEWDEWTTFSHGRAYAMTIDGLESTRPIEFPVERPVESWAMFDALTYQKGSAVLRMLEQYLGSEIFRRGISQYLKAHSYANTETTDLWDALEEASGQPVRSMMDTWVFQAGFPMVRAELSPEGRQLTLRAQPFRYHGEGHGVWQVPVTLGIYRAGESAPETVRGILGGEPLVVPVPEDMAWLTINQGGWGFYRSAYDSGLWSRLLGALDAMTAIERYQMVDDVWAAVLADEAPLSHAVKLWRALGSEQDPDVWGAVSHALSLLETMADDRGRQALERFIREIAGPVFDQVGWEPIAGEPPRRGRLRGTLVTLLGTLGGDASVQEEARRRWRLHQEGKQTAAPDLVTPLVYVTAASGDVKDWQAMYGAFKNAATPQDETRYLYALARFRDPDLLERTLALYHTSEVRLQDGSIALAHLLMNRHASRMTWESIESRWDELLAKFPKAMVGHFIQPTANIIEDRLADRISDWLTAHPVEEVRRLTAQAQEFRGINRALAHRVQGHLADILSD